MAESKTPVSVLILAKNEEKNIGDCLASVQWAAEIVVIDDNSTDRTPEIAREMGARVVTRALNGDWGAQQTFAIAQASCDWIYILDSDERVTPRLAEKLQELVKADDRRYAYCHARLNYFWEKPLRHGGWFPDYVVRLLPQKGTYVKGLVHQQICHECEEKHLPADLYVVHYPYRDWQHYFNKFNVYTDLAAKKMHEQGKRAHLWDFVLHPFWASFRMFFLRGGWRDGVIGFVLASFHYFYTMAKYVRLYYLDKSNGHVGDEH